MSPQVQNQKVYSSRNTFRDIKRNNFLVLNKPFLVFNAPLVRYI